MKPARGLLIAVLWCPCAAAGENAAEAVARMAAEAVAARPAVPTITAEALRATEPSPLLVDVRPAAERAVSILPGAIPLASLKTRKDRRERTVVFYCTIGVRSGWAARDWNRNGGRAVNLVGGILAWVHAGGRVITPEGRPTRRVHVYGPRWNHLPAGWTGVH